MNATTAPLPTANDTHSIQPSHPERLGPYQLDELLVERNGYAVFLATHIQRRHYVTLYLLPSLQGEDLEAFRRDVEAAERINHPSVARIVDSGDFEGFPYVAYEHIDGISVQRITKSEGKVSAAVACAIIRQAAIGLHHVHENGLLHGGITPANLMVTKSGVVKILSLAVAAHTADDPARPDATESANYLAPEQLAGHAEPRSDIYGLGCTLFSMLDGKSPLPSIERPRSNEKFTLPEKELGPSLISVVRAMMEIDPSKRIQLLTQVVGAMCHWASEDTLPTLVANHMQELEAPVDPPRVAETINQAAAANANPKNIEITPPPSQVAKIGPAVGALALVLAASYGGFLYFGSGQPNLKLSELPSSASPSEIPLQSRLALPKRVTPPTQADETPREVTSQQHSTSAIQATANSVASAAATTSVDPLEPEPEAPQPEQTAEFDIGPTETIAASLNLPEVVDKSVDAYHNRLQRQLLEEYGLSGGKWVLTPNEFAIISSAVSYGQRVSQDETTEQEDFGRLVRMHVAGKGAKPWAAGLYIPEVEGIEKGDRVLVIVWLRTSPGSNSEGRVGIFVESASDHKKEVYLTVKPTSEWRQFLIPFQAKVARDLRAGFHLAFQKQDIDYGGLTLINFGKTAPFWNAIPAGPRRRSTAE